MKNIARNIFEKQHFLDNKIICGIDEVGRGCLAGPVVTAAAVLLSPKKNSLIKDSKLLNEKQLEKAYSFLVKNSIFSIGICDARIIDKHNIYGATQLSMSRAFYQLCPLLTRMPDTVMVDAVKLQLPAQVISITKGELHSISIAAASIIAKVTRDRIMKRLHNAFPSYHLHTHKGYATREHYQALDLTGSSIIHRHTFLKKFHAVAAAHGNQLGLFHEG